MKTEVEKIMHKVIDDFNRAWRSHDEAKEGISKYADEVVKLFCQPGVISTVCPSCLKSDETEPLGNTHRCYRCNNEWNWQTDL